MSGGAVAIAAGIALVLLGSATLLLPQGWWPGRLPGDLTVHLRHATLYVPLASCLLLSAIASLVVALLRR